jgi:hypothetical protein
MMKIFIAATLLLALHGAEQASVTPPHLQGEENHEQCALAKAQKSEKQPYSKNCGTLLCDNGYNSTEEACNPDTGF